MEHDAIYNPLLHELKNKFSKASKPTTDNDLSIFIKQNISDSLLEKTNLNNINDRILISFNIDEKKQLTNIKTNARSKTVEKELISILEKYPSEKLINTEDLSLSNTCTMQTLAFENNQAIVKASSHISYERIPIFKNCEKYKTTQELKKCFSRGIRLHIERKFNFPLTNKLKLNPGKKSIICKFQIDKEGHLTKIKSPHPTLTKETKRVIQSIPKMVYPAMSKGAPVSVNYSLPIAFMVVANKPNYPATNINSYSNRNF
jgi:hypothetical protein